MKRSHYLGLYVIIAIAALLPFVLPNDFYRDLATRMALNAVIVLGLNLLVGYAGQVSLGHAGFVGIGAYATGILTSQFGWNGVVAMGAGACLAGIIALVAARPIFALKGNYLAMATLGLGIIISMILANENKITGGPDGMPVPELVLFGIRCAGASTWYWVVMVVLVLSIWASLNLIDSPFGRALRALHGSEIAAQVVGVDIGRYKLAIFVLAAAYASLMGSLTAHYVGYISPDIAGFQHSIELVTMVVVGGMASVYGSVVGAVLLTMLPQALTAFEGWDTAVTGLVLMLTMIFLPRGLVPSLAQRLAKLRRGG